MVILHPKDKISIVQEMQMVSCMDANVHNLAVEGTFDDCQVGETRERQSSSLLEFILSEYLDWNNLITD